MESAWDWFIVDWSAGGWWGGALLLEEGNRQLIVDVDSHSQFAARRVRDGFVVHVRGRPRQNNVIFNYLF